MEVTTHSPITSGALNSVSFTKCCLRHKLLQQEIALAAVQGIRKLVITAHSFDFSAIQCYETYVTVRPCVSSSKLIYRYTNWATSSKVRAGDVSL
jgi:hypothetical protein